MADYENKIIEAIQTIVDSAVNNAGYDKTITAYVISCVDATIAKYKVRYQNSTFYAYANNTEVTYTDGSEVYILIPNGDMSKDKTILGTTKKLGINYSTSAEGEEAYEPVGINAISGFDIFNLCSYKDQTVDIYEYNGKNNLINIDVKNFERYIKDSSVIVCGGNFKTNLSVDQQQRGNFGIIFELAFLDNASGEQVIRNYVLDVSQMDGNPYKMTNWKRQYGIFEIDSQNFQYIKKISLFSYDFPNKDINAQDDIFINNLEVYGANPLTEKELLNCALTFMTPQGAFFDKEDSDESIKTIQAQVRVKGKTIDNESQLLDFYWFKENAGITANNPKYNQYGGQGWECLNYYNIINSSPLIVEWVPEKYKINIKKKEVQALENKYKCVVVYGDTVLSKEIIIKNYSSNWSISIQSNQGNKFYFDIGNPTLSCIVKKDNQIVSEGLTYSWAEIDNNNNYLGMSETTEANKEYNKTLAAYLNLQKDLQNGTILPNAAQKSLNNYSAILRDYEKICRVEKNQIIHLKIDTITNFSTYKCSVYNNGVYIGTSSIIITNSLKGEGEYNLVIDNGNQVFKYNESGVSPASNSLENPIRIAPLAFTLYDNLGQAIDKNVLSNNDIEWTIPNKDTLIEISNKYGEDDIIESDNNIKIKGYTEISYSIKDRYDIKKTNNNIQLKVNYKGNIFITTTNFTFTKEGEPGTNGTDFVCKIVPNTSDNNYNLIPMMTTKNNIVTMNYTPENKSSKKFFRAQLWHNGVRIFNNSTTDMSTENKEVKVKWSVLKNKYSRNISDNTNISINENTGDCTFTPYLDNSMPANIIQCEIKYDGITYYATLPIVAAKVIGNHTIEWKENTGFKFAIYSSDGRNPRFDNSDPFELKVTNLVNGYQEDISELNTNNENNLKYNWNIVGKIYNPNLKKWENINNLILNRGVLSLKKNQYAIKPVDAYNGECLNNGLECIVSNNANAEVARIHIPIHLMLNRYGNAAINGWNGNSISIDENGSGAILAPQVGAGRKEDDESFTGVFMGEVKESGSSKSEVGLMGYAKGKRSIFLDSETGNATFGNSESSQFKITPAAAQDSNDTKVIAIHNNSKNDDIFYVTKGGDLVIKGDGNQLDLSTNKQITDINGNTSELESRIKAAEGKINLSVTKDNIIQSINLSTEEGAIISAKKINLEGAITASSFDLATAKKFQEIDEQITRVETQYYSSTSKSKLAGGEWKKENPEWEEGKYVWTKNIYYYLDNTKSPTESVPVCITGNTGKQGIQGPQGEQGMQGIQGPQGEQGNKGTDAKMLIITSNNGQVFKKAQGATAFTPTKITLTATLQGGLTGYQWYKDGTVISGATSQTYNVTSDKPGVYKCVSGSYSDSMTISQVTDGTNGTNGKDAYTILLSNESHSFAAGVSAAIAGTVETNIIAYKGATQVAATVGTISGLPTGLTAAISNNGTVNAKVTFTAATTLTTKAGVVTIPVTVDSKTFNKKFSYSLSFTGQTGNTGRGISSQKTQYVLQASGTTPPAASAYNDTLPTSITQGYYLWTKTTYTYSNNTTSEVITVTYQGKNGSDGRSITSIKPQYQASAKNDVAPTGTWSDILPTYNSAKPYIWYRQVVTWSTGTSPTYSTATLYDSMNDAMKTAYDTHSIMTSWASVNDKTLIDGGKIYANSIGASQIYVEDLNGIAASIGGFTIKSNSLTSGTGSNAVGMSSNGTNTFWAGNETPANAPFRVTKDGKLYATGANISGNISLTSGSKVQVIGDKGMLSNLRFEGYGYSESGGSSVSFGPYWLMGYTVTDLYAGKKGIVIDINIPDKFTVTEAYITLRHVPLVISGREITGDGTYGDSKTSYGYARNIRCSIGSTAGNGFIGAELYSEFYPSLQNISYKEISSCFDTSNNRYTPPAASASRLKIDEVTTKNIASKISKKSSILIMSSDSTPSDFWPSFQQSGYVTAVLDVYGYMQY